MSQPAHNSANRALLLTPRGPAAIAVVRLIGPAVPKFLRAHFSKEPKAGRCVHGILSDGPRIIDDPVIVLLPNDAGRGCEPAWRNVGRAVDARSGREIWIRNHRTGGGGAGAGRRRRRHAAGARSGGPSAAGPDGTGIARPAGPGPGMGSVQGGPTIAQQNSATPRGYNSRSSASPAFGGHCRARPTSANRH